MGCGGSKGGGVESNRQETKKRLLEEYTVGETLGEGAFGVVYACTNRATGQEVAVKMVDKVETPVQAIKEEADMLNKMNHTNIVKFHQVIYERCFVCIVMDKYKGGDLVGGMQHHWKTKGKIPCQNSLHVSRQMADSLHYLHGQSVVHRDVKGDNYLMDRKDIADQKCHIVLSDFGTACPIKPGERLHDGVGTKIFWSPEFYDRSYGLKVDIWAVGVIMYGLLDGRFPFRDEADVKNKNLRFPTSTAPVCEEYVRGMLAKDENKRLSAEEMAKHKWLTSNGEGAAGGADDGKDFKPEDLKDNEGGALRERRAELIERMENQAKTKGEPKAAPQHYWAEWFTIVDKHATNSTLKFEWWKQAKVEEKGILKLGGETSSSAADGEDKISPEVMKRMLESHNITTAPFGKGEAKSLDDLAKEVQSGAARMMLDATQHKSLVRVVDIVLLRILPSNCKPGQEKYLIETKERFADGREREMTRLPGTKKEPHENTKMVTERLVNTMLNLSDGKIVFNFKAREVFEEEEMSPSFPGVRTVYRKELVTGSITTTDDKVLSRIGLKGPSTFEFKDAKGYTKWFTWMSTKQCVQKQVQLKAPENSEDVSGLVQAPIGLNEEDLTKYLQACNIDIKQFGQGHTKSLKEFAAELQKGESSLMEDKEKGLLRVVDVVIVKIINSQTQSILMQTEQTFPDGQKVQLDRLPGTKRRPDENQFLTARRVLKKQLKMDENQVDINKTNVEVLEEYKDSASYPGLRTVYRKRIITATLMKT